VLAEIEYRAKSTEGKARHPFFKGLREGPLKAIAFRDGKRRNDHLKNRF
jgi:hypothetical protein